MAASANQRAASLKEAVSALQRIAPLDLAEEWDNAGLLLAPTRSRPVRRILLAIDATPHVVDEAVQRDVEMLVAYHPPWFFPVNRLTPDDDYSGRILRLIENRIAVYSPHTALDAAEEGVNDWLAGGMRTRPADRVECHPGSIARIVRFALPVSGNALAKTIQQFLKVSYLRWMPSSDRRRRIRSLAVCAGAGVEALKETQVDAWLTGEMKHHDLLAAQARGIGVVLAEHSHTERGYLAVLRRRLNAELHGKATVLVSRADREPLRLFTAVRDQPQPRQPSATGSSRSRPSR